MLTGLAASWDGRFVAYSDNGDGPVHVLAVDTRQLVATFPTILEAGGSRLEISSRGRVAAAAYRRRGVAVYEGRDGICLWQRQDITQLQRLVFDATGERLWCVTETGPTHCLDAADGSTLEKFKGVRWLHVDHVGNDVVVFDGRQYRLISQGPRTLASSLDSGPLAGAFGTRAFCVSEIGGPLRYFDVSTCRELHRVTPREGWHWTGIGFVASADAFALIGYPYQAEGRVILESFDPVSGRLHEVAELTSPKYVFCERGAFAVGSHGDLRRTSDGALVHHFRWFVE